MRSTRLAIVIVFMVSSLDCKGADETDASGQEVSPHPSFSALHRIEVKQNIRFVRVNENLEQLCGSPGELRGCTTFPDESFDCQCHLESEGWRMRIVARLDLSILVDEPRTLMHERQHLLHLRGMLDDYLLKMTMPVFASRSNCMALANILSRGTYVRAMMNELRRASNEHFQCSRPGSEGVPALLVHHKAPGAKGAATAR